VLAKYVRAGVKGQKKGKMICKVKNKIKVKPQTQTQMTQMETGMGTGTVGIYI
jgi:hypothetical protein